jgi:hypothetical protein
MQHFNHNNVFEIEHQFTRRKLSKIAENCRKSPKIVLISSTPGFAQTANTDPFLEKQTDRKIQRMHGMRGPPKRIEI